MGKLVFSFSWSYLKAHLTSSKREEWLCKGNWLILRCRAKLALRTGEKKIAAKACDSLVGAAASNLLAAIFDRKKSTKKHLIEWQCTFKWEVRRKMNFTYVLGFVVLRDVVKVFPVSSSSFARKTTPRNRYRVRSHSGGMTRPKDEMGSQMVSSESDISHPILVYLSRNNDSRRLIWAIWKESSETYTWLHCLGVRKASVTWLEIVLFCAAEVEGKQRNTQSLSSPVAADAALQKTTHRPASHVAFRPGQIIALWLFGYARVATQPALFLLQVDFIVLWLQKSLIVEKDSMAVQLFWNRFFSSRLWRQDHPWCGFGHGCSSLIFFCFKASCEGEKRK